MVAAWQCGPAGDFVNLTWPGYVGVVNAMAPGRFAVAINQPPIVSWGAGPPIDWAIERARMWRSSALPPSHLLRRVCENCATYAEAKQALIDTPLCMPAFFILAGIDPGDGCIIERMPDGMAIREMPSAIANHWVALPQRGRPRGLRSRERLKRMETAVCSAGEPWLVSPIVNRHTRLVAALDPGGARLVAQGWERNGPATAELVLSLPIAQIVVPLTIASREAVKLPT